MTDVPQLSTMSLEDISTLAEDIDLEVKLARGRDGRGELPNSFFETYSAMANTDGGTVLLGVREHPRGRFSVEGLQDVPRILKKLWDELNNRDKVSANLLSHSRVREVDMDGRTILRIDIPRAARSARPVHLGRDPLRGTYRRMHEGDYPADPETVRRMLAEQVEDARDARVLQEFGRDDLEPSSLASYRNLFASVRPDHPWNTLDSKEFMRMIGAYGRDRENGAEGPTLGGLLMFGRLPSILDQLPHYILDYQEQDPESGTRWLDRVTTDGSWPGNLFEFYRLVMPRLTADLKVPFRLQGDRRSDETPVHEALREALVNALIHADYTGRVSVLATKRPDGFAFRNPGTSRIPLESAVRGGESDCRNRRLQKMFQLAGLGEQAGSGIPKIYRNWRGQQWFPPRFSERLDPDQTALELNMRSFIPAEAQARLRERFGERLDALDEAERLALALAAAEGTLTHARLKDVAGAHPADASKALSHLVREGFLDSSGAGRGVVYSLPEEDTPEAKTLRERYLDSVSTTPPTGADDTMHGGENSVHSAESSVHNEENSVHNEESSVHNEENSVHTNPDAAHLPDPRIYPLLRAASSSVRGRARAPRAEVERTILELCAEHFLSLRDLADLMGRTQETLRIHYLGKMIRDGRLVQLHPSTPNHPRQCYRVARRDETP
ncbi:MAG: putative DNA binding domain-containing protein [Desulfovibrionaceae bacterium]|nr:putative DNA binding domain-containing protein [Desulfovibrionaceae bacterium]